MKIICNSLGIDMLLDENKENIIYFENQECFSKMIELFLLEESGIKTEDLYVIEDNFPINTKTTLEVIINPFGLSVNDKKVVTKLQTYISNFISNSELYTKNNELNSFVCSYMYEVLNNIDYNVRFSTCLSPLDYVKFLNVEIDEDYGSLYDRIITYIKTVSSLLDKKLFVFVNLHTYLSHENILLFNKEICYNKLNVIYLEYKYNNALFVDEKNKNMTIFDNDSCVLRI